ncbi:ATP-binding protein [Streptomyces sp. KMM 9044]|uniref:ATP-binding protein n=1 Tax=Streptomyces sp. KMM 9044 TaxID=2744474 RepID=UPI0021509336|nr:ATP-binding protein [Streptomyces sp. KMM 9044]WAX79273.1 ATP-binding protein [Streptomyces sp. KMM 9044]
MKASGVVVRIAPPAAELLANAHPHTTGPYALRLRAAEAGRLRVGVWDTDPRVPPGFVGTTPLAAPPDESENGRGLPLVRACVSVWGVGRGGGRGLWAECGG